MVNQWPRQDRGGPGRGRKSSSPFLSRGCLSLGPREGGRRKAKGGEGRPFKAASPPPPPDVPPLSEQNTSSVLFLWDPSPSISPPSPGSKGRRRRREMKSRRLCHHQGRLLLFQGRLNGRGGERENPRMGFPILACASDRRKKKRPAFLCCRKGVAAFGLQTQNLSFSVSSSAQKSKSNFGKC